MQKQVVPSIAEWANVYRFNYAAIYKCRKYSRQRTQYKKQCSVSWVFVVKKNNSEIQVWDPYRKSGLVNKIANKMNIKSN